MTFRELEKKYSVEWLPEEQLSSLSEWYLAVRDTDIAELDVGNVCRSLRQDLFVSDLLAVAASFLAEDVLAGDRYDGELVSALADINVSHWAKNSSAANVVADALKGISDISQDAVILGDVSRLVAALQEIN